MSFDNLKNLAYGTVLTAPVPATTGLSLVLSSGVGGLFPTPPFQATVWPAGQNPLASNSEVIRCTAKATDTLTILRGQEGTTARAIAVGDQIAATITAKTIVDLQTVLAPAVKRCYYKPLDPTQVYVTTLSLSDGTTVLTARTHVTNTLGEWFYFDQNVVGLPGYIAHWDEGDPTQTMPEVITVP